MSHDILVSTKDQIGDFDAIESAKPGEPLFPIQGGDPLGPATVQFWAKSARDEARRIMDGVRAGFEPASERDEYQPTEADKNDAERLLVKATNAEQVSWAMKAYQRGDVQPTGGRANYNDGVVEHLTVEAGDRAAKRKALIALSGELHNGLGIAFGVADALARLGEHPEIERDIRRAVEVLKSAAEEIEPRRGMERS